jgi:hypothetical protein
MLIHHGEMVAILLHGFVPSTEASEHLQTLGYLFRYGSTISRSCSRKSRMALFGHRFCRFDFTVDRYRHPTTNVKNKETWSQEELERSVDAWATEFVKKNLRPQLTSWLQELDGFFLDEQLPFSTSRIGRTCFTAMAVTENYHSTSHMDRHLSNSVIS